ncbi:MAG: FprA family A-type flavoprotein, partial [Rikenellaceae bacterium]|nr:FprA family A-type flavoprotein [Rikenellaceae bacterium]
IHGGTAEAACKMAQILTAKGAANVVLTDLSRCDMSKAVADAFRVGRLIVAAASYDADVFPPMHDFLHHLRIKGFRRRRVGIIENGSWALCAGKVMRTMLGGMADIEIAEPMVTLHSRMKRANLPSMEALADTILA